MPLHFHQPGGQAVYISQSVNSDAAGIREDGEDGLAGDLINSSVATLSQVYLGVLVYSMAANKQGRCVRAANRKAGISKLLRTTKIMKLKKQNVNIFGGIKVGWPENSQGDYILHPHLYNSINALHLSLQLLQGTKLEDDFLSHSTDFLSRGSLYPRLPAQWRSSPAVGGGRITGCFDKMAKAKPKTTDGRRWRRWRICWMNLQAWVILAYHVVYAE